MAPLNFGDLAFLTFVVGWAHVVCTMFPQDPKEIEHMHDDEEDPYDF